jgi:sulfoxide reductase heme-binding subunit YedZ
MQKRLGKSWRRLHQLVYLAGICAVIHYFWLVKSDDEQPIIYASILFLLLGYRLLNSRRA